jgi:hypothetical protein
MPSLSRLSATSTCCSPNSRRRMSSASRNSGVARA